MSFLGRMRGWRWSERFFFLRFFFYYGSWGTCVGSGFYHLLAVGLEMGALLDG